jgi:peptidoglycan/LPS O-acetylase OafA/YrhL
MSALHYRSDIDGLRAIAVLSVVLYHFGIGGLQGGFVGVDVFFVISGYLITGIIQSELARGEFTLARFYERRARRIFPALFVMLLVTMLVGLFVLLPSDLARLGQAATATVLFVSNALYFRQSGYFDDASDFNALLHTWSLGVEEQFYVGLPLLLMLVHRYRPQWLLRVIAACALLSFAACVLVQPILAKAVFFLSPFRAWELLLGSLVALGAAPQVRNGALRAVLSLAALAALLGAIAFMRSGVDFPGWKAAIPVLATAVLLHLGAGGRTWVGAILSWRPLVFVGLISYSLYLWHWPLLVMVSYRQGMAPLDSLQALVLLGVSLLLAVGSYRFVEQPFRRWRKRGEAAPRGRVFAASGVVALLLVGIGVWFAATHGLSQRVPPQVLALDQARLPVIPYKECDGKPVSMARAACRIGAEGNRKVTLVWGDSWAIAWAPALDEVLKREGRTGILAVHSACAPLPGVDNLKSPTCVERNAQILEWIREHRPERVYLIAFWQAWANPAGGYPLQDLSWLKGNDRIFEVAYPRTLQAITPYVKDIVVVGPVPGAPKFLPYQLALVDWSGKSRPPSVTRLDAEKDASWFWRVAGQPSGGTKTIDPVNWFCDQVACRYLDQGKLLYRDGHHLSVDGARFVARHLIAMEQTAILGSAMEAR